MKEKAQKFFEELEKKRVEILNAIYDLLDERNIESINLYEYWANDFVDRNLFFTCDDCGYGKALYVDTLVYKKDGEKKSLELAMKDVDDFNFDTWCEDDLFESSQMFYLLSMIEDIVEFADEEHGGRILKADETFDDWEDVE